jgi:hypothetical protein
MWAVLLTSVALLSGLQDPAPVAESVRTEYEAARAKTGRDASAQVRLAEWCAERGLESEKNKHLGIAILVDPNHERARELLGLAPRGKNADAAAEASSAAALAEYNAKKRKTARSADAQWGLALWCEQKGLKAEATAHLAEVVRLDPKRGAAWKRLGFKNVNGRWMSQEQLDADNQRKQDESLWSDTLTNLHRWIHKGARHAEAEKALAQIEDPRAVLPIYREFGRRGPADQLIAVQLLGQIKSPESSKTLAVLTVYGATPDVRRRATESLRTREPGDFAEIWVSLLSAPMRYEVRPVGGPGSPGALFVEGEQINLRRLYAAPGPTIPYPRPGDLISFDAYGLPVIMRVLADVSGISSLPESRNPFVTKKLSAGVQYSVRENILQAQRAAFSSQAQLESDVREIEGLNEAKRSFNAILSAALQEVTGKNLGTEPAAWKEWLDELRGSRRPETKHKQTLTQLVPPSYSPTFLGQLTLVATYGPKSADN